MENIDNGSMISGKWISTVTGEAVNVINSIIDGDNMVIITDHGQISMEEFSANYIQCDEENIIIDTNSMKPDINYNVPTPKPTSTTNNNINAQNIEIERQLSENDLVLKRFFGKINGMPKISINIEWPELSYEKFKLFIDMLDINTDEISKYIKKNYIDDISIILTISDFLEEKKQKNDIDT